MTLEEAIDLLCSEYEKALEDDYVFNPLAYALYRVWKIADHNGRSTNLKDKCGSCFYAKPVTEGFGGSKCYVECTCEEHLNRYRHWDGREIKAVRARTRYACNEYKPKEGA